LNDLLGAQNTPGSRPLEVDIHLVGTHIFKRTGRAHLDTGGIAVALVANNGFAQAAIDETGPEGAGVTAGTAADAFFFANNPGARFRISADGIHRTNQFAHRRLTLHTGRRDKLHLTVFFGFNRADARSFRIAFLHISKRAADLTHLAAAALFRMNNDNVAHSPASIKFSGFSLFKMLSIYL
jgi:hypothetical protein